MCWFIDLKIKLLSENEKIKMPKDFSYYIIGDYPDYFLTDNRSCSCNLVDNDGNLKVDIIPALSKILENNNVKSLILIWYWNKPPRKFKSEKMRLNNLEKAFNENEIKQGVYYIIEN